MAVRDGRGDVKQTTTGFRGPLMVQSLTSAKSKFLSLYVIYSIFFGIFFLSAGLKLLLSKAIIINEKVNYAKNS